jgi:hypothetical protein
MTSVNFKYDLQQTVRVKAIGITGKIDSMLTGVNGEEYRVVYWYNGERKAVWMYDWEIEVLSLSSERTKQE